MAFGAKSLTGCLRRFGSIKCFLGCCGGGGDKVRVVGWQVVVKPERWRVVWVCSGDGGFGRERLAGVVWSNGG